MLPDPQASVRAHGAFHSHISFQQVLKAEFPALRLISVAPFILPDSIRTERPSSGHTFPYNLGTE